MESGIPGAPGCFGALRPEKRVRAKSKLPQKKCVGLTLPMKRERNCVNIRFVCTNICQKRSRIRDRKMRVLCLPQKEWGWKLLAALSIFLL